MKNGNLAAMLFVFAGVVFIAVGAIPMLFAEQEARPGSLALGCTFLILAAATKTYASR